MPDNRYWKKLPDRLGRLQASYYCLPLLLAMLANGCASQMTSEVRIAKCVSQSSLQKTDHPPIGQVGNILLVEKPRRVLSAQKVFVGAFKFETDKFGNDKIGPQELVIAFGTGKIPYSQQCDFWFELVDVKDNVLARFGISDPRQLIVDDQNKQKMGGFVKVPVAKFAARFPFSADAKEIRVLNAQEQPVTSTNVRAAIYEFCAAHEKDPDCRAVTRR